MKKISEYLKYNTKAAYLFLAVYGVITAYIIVKTTRMANPLGYLEDYYMSLRVTWLDTFIKEVSETGIYTGLHRLYNHNSSMYLYLSYFGSFMGYDAMYTFFKTQISMIWLCAAIFPVIFFRLTNNFFIALTSILFFKLYNPFCIYLLSDSYWIYGWITFISVPILLFLFTDKWKNSNIIWIVCLLPVIAAGNVFRSSSSAALTVCLLMLVIFKLIIPCFKQKSYKKILLNIFLCLIIFFSQNFLTDTVPQIYQKITNQPDKLETMGPWHSLYIGLGWEENPMGIEYSDASGYAGREDTLYDISDGYYLGLESPQYINEIKNDYIKTVFSNLSFCVFSYIKKALVCFVNSFKYSIINIFQLNSRYYYVNYFSVFITLFILVFLIKNKHKIKQITDFKKYALSALFILTVFYAFGMIPGMAATPIVREYIFGSIACVDCIVLFGYILSLNLIYKIFSTHDLKIKI